MKPNEFRDLILSKARLFLFDCGISERFSESSWRELKKTTNQFLQQYPSETDPSLLFNFLDEINSLRYCRSRQHQNAMAKEMYDNLCQILYPECTEYI